MSTAAARRLIVLTREHELPVRNASADVEARLRRHAVATTDTFVEDFFGEDARLDVLVGILRGFGPGVTELKCRPARVDDELRSTSGCAAERERELEVLTSPEARQAVKELSLRLVYFGTAWSG